YLYCSSRRPPPPTSTLFPYTTLFRSAGFDNSGESLSMSPALLNKYLQAAREAGDHLVLTPDGFAFSPHPMLVETDREKYAIQRRSEEHTSELQSRFDLVCRLLLEKKN